jgi:hypothetical protein
LVSKNFKVSFLAKMLDWIKGNEQNAQATGVVTFDLLKLSV